MSDVFTSWRHDVGFIFIRGESTQFLFWLSVTRKSFLTQLYVCVLHRKKCWVVGLFQSVAAMFFLNEPSWFHDLCNQVICMVASPVRFPINCSVFLLESVKTVCRKKSRGDGWAVWPKARAETECGCFFVFCKSVKRHDIITGLQVKLTLCELLGVGIKPQT